MRTQTARVLLAGLVVVSLGVGGCTQVLGIEDTTLDTGSGPVTIGPCKDQRAHVCSSEVNKLPAPPEGGFQAPWQCVGFPEPLPDAPPMIKFTIGRLLGTATQQPVAGVTVKACPVALDPSCSAPAATTVTDSTGAVSLDLPVTSQGFSGFFLFEGPEIFTGLLYFSFPLFKDFDLPQFKVAPAGDGYNAFFTGLSNFEGKVGARIDGRGHLDAIFLDCTGEKEASGVSLRIDQGSCDLNVVDCATVPFYVSGGDTSSTATATDQFGEGGFLNLNPGKITVVGYANDIETVVTAKTISIRENAQTSVFFLPNR